MISVSLLQYIIILIGIFTDSFNVASLVIMLILRKYVFTFLDTFQPGNRYNQWVSWYHVNSSYLLRQPLQVINYILVPWSYHRSGFPSWMLSLNSVRERASEFINNSWLNWLTGWVCVVPITNSIDIRDILQTYNYIVIKFYHFYAYHLSLLKHLFFFSISVFL